MDYPGIHDIPVSDVASVADPESVTDTESVTDPESVTDTESAPVRLCLEGWYADPLDTETARLIENRAARAQAKAVRTGGSAGDWPLLAMVARFWLGRPVAQDHGSLRETATEVRDRALADLVYGQLLMSRKRPDGREWLARGFAAAAPLLAPRAYFEVLRRHELLDCLVPGEGGPARSLDALLAEAAVIRRLRGDPRARARSDHHDTVG